MRSYRGVVVSGAGRMSRRMDLQGATLKRYEAETGLLLVPGTLNIKLSAPVDMPRYARTITRRDGDVYITPALVMGIAGFVVRHSRTEGGRGRHTKDVVEVISSAKLRDVLQLADGDSVIVEF